MSFFASSLFVALSITSAFGNPLPSKVARADPTPSSYPLGDACGNEWQYLNFDPEAEKDKTQLRMLHEVICSGELRAISSWGGKAASDSKTSTNEAFDLFFDADNRDNVYSVLMTIAGQSSFEGRIGKAVGKMVVDQKNFGPNVDPDEDCDNEGTWAYTDTDTDNLEKIHFCDMAFDLPMGPDIKCANLDTFPSEKMDLFSRVVLHEMMHIKAVGEGSSLGLQIIDVTNYDGEPAYGVERAHGLVDDDQDGTDEKGGLDKVDINADNYAYMALTAWVGYHCSPDDEKESYDSYFPDEPPHYT